ncbi:Ubiquitin carboxyl-terminal hydrolase 51 [Quaeritorhiza haematococci]|nr:Ubiquitin carboxyl-terminal hydrolase 51 [Quaeritorhiza haematococci]
MPKISPLKKAAAAAAAAAENSLSPYAVFRTPGESSFHGCPHVAALKAATNSNSNAAPTHQQTARATVELLESYRTCVRYSLSYRNRHQVHMSKKSKKQLQMEEEEAAAASGVTGKKRKRTSALEKEINAIEKFFEGTKVPYGPSSFLYAMWMCQKHLSGYQQQDAHEFYISVLNEIHNNCNKDNETTVEPNCRCIIHQIFGGVLQSDVTCLKCGNVTSANDPILDLSVDVKLSSSSSSSSKASKKSSKKKKDKDKDKKDKDKDKDKGGEDDDGGSPETIVFADGMEIVEKHSKKNKEKDKDKDKNSSEMLLLSDCLEK